MCCKGCANERQRRALLPCPEGPEPGGPRGQQLVFGVDLDALLTRERSIVPRVVVRLSEFLLRGDRLRTTGVFRLSGSLARLNTIKLLLDAGHDVDLEQVEGLDEMCAAAILKAYFRELPDALLTGNLYDGFLAISGSADSAIGTDEMTSLLRLLPTSNKVLLFYLLAFLMKVTQFQEENKMTVSNLAIVWAPNLLRSSSVEAAEEAQFSGAITKVMRFLLDNAVQLWQNLSHVTLFEDDVYALMQAADARFGPPRAPDEDDAQASTAASVKDHAALLRAQQTIWAQERRALEAELQRMRVQVQDAERERDEARVDAQVARERAALSAGATAAVFAATAAPDASGALGQRAGEAGAANDAGESTPAAISGVLLREQQTLCFGALDQMRDVLEAAFAELSALQTNGADDASPVRRPRRDASADDVERDQQVAALSADVQRLRDELASAERLNSKLESAAKRYKKQATQLERTLAELQAGKGVSAKAE